MQEYNKQQEERQKTNGRKMFGIKRYQEVVFKRRSGSEGNQSLYRQGGVYYISGFLGMWKDDNSAYHSRSGDTGFRQVYLEGKDVTALGTGST